MDPSDFLHGGALFRRVHVLVVRLEGFVVPDVSKTFAANASDHIVSLVHAVARTIHILARRRQIAPQEGLPLHVVRDLHAGKIHHGRPEIDRTDQPIIRGIGHALAADSVRRRNTHHQGDMGARVIQPSFRARQAHAMVRPEEYDGIVVQAIRLQLAYQVPCPGVHGRDQFVVALPVFTCHRRVRIIGRQCQPVRVLSL